MESNGYRNHMATMAAWLLLSAWPCLAQEGDAWRRVNPGQPVWKDPTRTDGWDHENGRLAADGAGRLYFTNGASLLIGTQGGGQWQSVSRGATTPGLRLLAAAGPGRVAWGTSYSADGGVTWKDLTFYPVSFGGRWGVHRSGYLFAGGGSDEIKMAKPPHATWDVVSRAHAHNFGYICQFAVSEAGHVAALGFDALYLSADSGSTWIDWMPLTRDQDLHQGTVHSLGIDPRLGTTLWMSLSRWIMVERYLVRMDMVTREVERVAPPDPFPDSLINVIRVSRDGSIWLGTWGQGVWTSRDGGKSFTAFKSGLSSLFIMSLQETSDGFMFALTPEGLYRYQGPTTALHAFHPRPARVVGQAALQLPGLPTSLQPSTSARARFSVLPDGRRIIPAQRSGTP